MFVRKLQLILPKRQSAFLWGARRTGKSSYLQETFPESIYYDLLNTHDMIRLAKSPYLLREEILGLPKKKLLQPVIIDEIQKLPELLNEIHWLIENTQAAFILCGSSARKLKSQSTNLLGGRAWPFYFYPLCFAEIPEFDLYQALHQGLIPNHYLAQPKYINDYLRSYVEVYLTDEIRNEGLVRNLAGFARFLDVAGMTNSQMINANNIARDCGVDRTTVQSYFQILVDTLLGDFVYPYRKKVKRDIVTATPKFYVFDVAVANYLGQRQVTALKGEVAGQSLEHYIFMELKAYLGMQRSRKQITYWRTKSGFEVDFVITAANKAELAIEVKISDKVHQQDIKGLIAFGEEHTNCQLLVVSQDKRTRKLQVNEQLTIIIMPWRTFLKKLWTGELIAS